MFALHFWHNDLACFPLANSPGEFTVKHPPAGTKVKRERFFASAGDESAFLRREDPPLARRQNAQPEVSDAHAQQTQGWMADRRCHAAHLAVFAFDEFQPNPAIRDAFAETNGRIAGKEGGASVILSRHFLFWFWFAGSLVPRDNIRLRLKQPRTTGQSLEALNYQAAPQFFQDFARRD